jgi:hypothetical protein
MDVVSVSTLTSRILRPRGDRGAGYGQWTREGFGGG